MAALFDRIGDWLGVVSAWMFFAVGGMIGYEVTARYIFVAPTIWAEEMSRFFQIWATYLAAATMLRHQELIRITFIIGRLGPRAWRAAEIFSLSVIAIFSATAIWYGMAILLESLRLHRTTATLFDIPQWTTEIVIPLGFGMLLIQCLIEIARVARGERRQPPPVAQPRDGDIRA
jgi:TRAP-type C4-dicarboxylate transport system permease small subunit